VAAELRMPSLGADMEEGTLVEWRIKPGQRVKRGDIVAVIETSKGIIDIESFEEGVIARLVAEPGTCVPVGTPLAVFEGAAPAATRESAPPMPSPPAPHRQAVSPAARARAQVLGVELSGLQGSGADGAITLQDVERVAAARGAPARPVPSAAAPAAARAAVAAATAAAMARSKREIPHYYLQLSMDFTTTLQWLEAYNRERPVTQRLLPAALLVRAIALAARQHTGFSGYHGTRGFEPAAAVHVGMAIALRGGGLVAPALLHADEKPLANVMQELQDLVTRARAGHLRASELASPTITLTSLGEEGVDVLIPVIHPPQVAIVGAGSVTDRAWAVDGRVEARKVLALSLAADHRVTDGRRGAQFLAAIRDLLSHPEKL
jgi:pyruvate dehydrogenase E2 component (dihydrolipoamide acetyltransferase)